MSDEWLGVALPWGPAIPSFIEPKVDDAILRASVLWILLTRPGERVMLPEFGSTLLDAVFEQNDPALLASLETTVREALNRWDDRVELVSFEATIPIENPNQLDMHIIWKNARDPISEKTQILDLALTPTTVSIIGG